MFEHWGGDAEMLSLRSPVTGAVGLSGPLERAQVAARTVTYYDLDSLQIVYPDGAKLLAGRIELVLLGPRRGVLRRRDRRCAPRSTSCCKRSPRGCSAATRTRPGKAPLPLARRQRGRERHSEQRRQKKKPLSRAFL